MERRVVPVGAVVLTTFFALLYALRGSIVNRPGFAGGSGS